MVRALLISSIIITMGGVIYGSGTYRAPVQSKKKKPFNRADIARGEKYFKGNKLGQGKSCNSCHGGGQKFEFKRYVLQRKGKQLKAEINNCITKKDRVHGKELSKGEKELVTLGAYIISKYRLDNDLIEPLNN